VELGISRDCEVSNCKNCWKCLDGVMVELFTNPDKEGDQYSFKIPATSTRMLLCPNCGCKRCPKASDHELECTDSNEAGQEGSVYR